jgi:hypothetical protein
VITIIESDKRMVGGGTPQVFGRNNTQRSLDNYVIVFLDHCFFF